MTRKNVTKPINAHRGKVFARQLYAHPFLDSIKYKYFQLIKLSRLK